MKKARLKSAKKRIAVGVSAVAVAIATVWGGVSLNKINVAKANKDNNVYYGDLLTDKRPYDVMELTDGLHKGTTYGADLDETWVWTDGEWNKSTSKYTNTTNYVGDATTQTFVVETRDGVTKETIEVDVQTKKINPLVKLGEDDNTEVADYGGQIGKASLATLPQSSGEAKILTIGEVYALLGGDPNATNATLNIGQNNTPKTDGYSVFLPNTSGEIADADISTLKTNMTGTVNTAFSSSGTIYLQPYNSEAQKYYSGGCSATYTYNGPTSLKTYGATNKTISIRRDYGDYSFTYSGNVYQNGLELVGSGAKVTWHGGPVASIKKNGSQFQFNYYYPAHSLSLPGSVRTESYPTRFIIDDCQITQASQYFQYTTGNYGNWSHDKRVVVIKI